MRSKKSFVSIAVLVAGLMFTSISYAGNGRGVMDGTGPLSVVSGCQGTYGPQAGSGQQQMYRGKNSNTKLNGNSFGRR